MQIHRSRELTITWHRLPVEVRRFVEALRTNPRPEGALSMDERSGRYEEFIAGYWIAWRIIDTEKEIVIQVGITE